LKRVLKVGLTGNLGSGKSTVARMLKELGASVLDADAAVKDLLRRKEVKQKIAKEVSPSVFTPEGEVDRKKLANLVFSDPQKLRRLEAILHPLVYEEFERFCAQRGGVCVLEAALIFEKGNADRFDLTVLVYAPKEVAKKRALERGMDAKDFERRWALQMPPEEKRKLADFVIDNSGSLEKTKRQVGELFSLLQARLEGP